MNIRQLAALSRQRVLPGAFERAAQARLGYNLVAEANVLADQLESHLGAFRLFAALTFAFAFAAAFAWKVPPLAHGAVSPGQIFLALIFVSIIMAAGSVVAFVVHNYFGHEELRAFASHLDLIKSWSRVADWSNMPWQPEALKELGSRILVDGAKEIQVLDRGSKGGDYLTVRHTLQSKLSARHCLLALYDMVDPDPNMDRYHATAVDELNREAVIAAAQPAAEPVAQAA